MENSMEGLGVKGQVTEQLILQDDVILIASI